MIDVTQLGWEAGTVGELDHRLLKAPHVKLRAATQGPTGGVVYAVDLRINQPNSTFLSSTEMHSFEHFLLWGFQKYMPQNFISVGLMGCQTGFYLILFNEGRAGAIMDAYEKILNDILAAGEVPYANIAQCGNYKNHSLEMAQALARRVLDAKANWRQVV
ncbi:MAG: S-ribosylhomocysteine lyase [Anaerolineales bacterium]|nr:S-ribosylhomocysteine lyase [Anaerolineales bacterium]NUQ83677.1 S-ribosylhomocysteine lyase [Anaerolineales bacterium]